MDHPQGFLDFDSSWSEAPPNFTFHITPSPYPKPQYLMPQHLEQHPLMPFGTANIEDSWGTDAILQLLGPAHAQEGLARDAHERGYPSQTGLNSPQIATAFAGPRQDFGPKKLLPITAQMAVQMPVQNMFLAPVPQNDNLLIHNGDTATVDRSDPTPEDDTFLHSSVSPSVPILSHYNSPMTPQMTYDHFDDALICSKNRCPDSDYWGEYSAFNANPDCGHPNVMSMGFPELNCPTPDIYNDDDIDILSTSAPRMQKANTNMGYQSYQNLFADQINAANQGSRSTHSRSPAGIMRKRKRPPFHQGYPLAADTQQQVQLQASRLGTALQLPDTQKDADGRIRTTSLNALEDSEGLDVFTDGPSLLLPSNDMAFCHGNITFRQPAFTGAFQPTLADDFTGTSPAQATGVQYSTQEVHVNNAVLQQTPGYAVSLPAGTTNDDGNAGPPSKQPHSASSDSDIYTCTYHGCTLRFETPRKLQQHKRQAHRSMMAGQNGETPSSLALGDSQAGPHKCERINPSTGKPCSSIFSRPYDLTRHEDTIHNTRKQKLRCHLCSKEKTFTRNDALTRHMRVVHPEVPLPRKQRREGH